ncbi:YibE/F family protein [Clostridium sp.]|jgi:uncharacterized membrane protein|uniref:YibE/F family protein n=1 Tax=Clostridium sp. TaxID=1506 RepID=UPI002587FE06|nr:YibE/F family protein [Clostridium sp.]MDF2506082.1 hypothetical protein [Clostridium sp.]
MKKKYFFILLLSLMITIIGFSSAYAEGTNQASRQDMNSYKGYTDAKGKVIKLEPNNRVDVKIISGKYKGQTLEVDDLKQFKTTDSNGSTIGAKVGDEVYLSIQQDDDGNIKNALIYDYIRYKPIIIVIVIFVILLALIGGVKGIKSLIPLVLTAFSIVKIVVPAIEKGMNPVLISVIVCIGLLVINLLIISGINKKTAAAIIGSIFGIISSTVLMFITGSSMKIIGIGDEQVEVLMSIFSSNNINFKGVLFAGIILGTLGALIDISISIASAMNEIYETNPNISKREFIKSGMNMGKDIIGAMSNTLILAYAGSSLIVLLIVLSSDLSFIKIVNEDVIASEIFKALIGSIGLILSVPCTVITMAQFKVLSQNK